MTIEASLSEPATSFENATDYSLPSIRGNQARPTNNAKMKPAKSRWIWDNFSEPETVV